jgi:hypothetical protein
MKKRPEHKHGARIIRRGKTHILIPDKEPTTYIPLSDCKHGWLYKVRSRNLTLGIFREDKKGFVGIREKFGEEYLFVEFHWDTGPPFGTVKPLECLVSCPIQNLDEYIHIKDGKHEVNTDLFDWLKQLTTQPVEKKA